MQAGFHRRQNALRLIARSYAPFRQKRLDGQAWTHLPVLYRQRGAGKTALRARKDMQAVLGTGAG